ncbi:MAG: T9SS type A sorting domain-containing protein [Bacteroidia bacterium]|nr:T9SS type A sorting domain-containing protein [Bacteroidia bacterium]
MKRVAIILLAFTVISLPGWAQSFLNGNFEINTAGTDKINMTNTAFNATMSNTFGFGTYGGGVGNLDIISSTTYGLGPQSGSWYIAFTGGGTDQVTMQLSSPLIAGNTYSVIFYDNRWSSYTGPPMELGVTNTIGTFGTLVHSNPGPVSNTQWTQRTAVFSAPLTGGFLSVRSGPPASGSVWTKVDNFSFGTILPVENLSLRAERISEQQVKVDWAVSNGADYTYEVQRSFDGENFISRGKGQTLGIGAEGWHFDFLDDNSAVSEAFYRLRIVDIQGNEHFSQAYKINGINAEADFVVFPVPASEEVVASTQGSFLSGKWKLEVFDLQGRMIFSNAGEDGFAQTSLDLKEYRVGAYLVKFTHNGQSHFRRIIKE